MPITSCDSPETLKAETETVRKIVSLDETEETWDKIAQGIRHLTHLCNNGGCEFPSEMVAGIRSISKPLNNALNSERSRLSGVAAELLTALVTGLGASFEPLVSLFVPTLVTLCGRTNKVFTSRARACILAVVQHTRLPALLPYLAEMANHKSVLPRLTAAEGILACLNCFNPPDLEKETRARIVENFIKLTARDASADVRKASKEVFKAYKILLPWRVDNFVAPLTPVVRKYLDIQPSTSYGMGQKQTSRPSSRTNDKVTEAVHRSTSSTLSKVPTRPDTYDPVHSARLGQRPAVHGPPIAPDNRVPRQRTVSQMQRDPPQPRNAQINLPSSTAAQRCLVPTSAPARQVSQPVAARVLPAPNATLTSGPQRPPPVQLRLNPPPDRLKMTGSGAKRIPLPPAPPNEHASEQVATAGDSGGRVSSAVDKLRSKLPTRNTEATVTGKLAAGRKAPEGTRSTSSSTRLIAGAVPTSRTGVHRSQQRAVKGEMRIPRRTTFQRRPAGNAENSTRSLANTEKKESSPTLIPLPTSPSTPPTGVPLPPSPDGTPDLHDPEAQDKPVAVTPSGTTEHAGKQLGSAKPCQEQGDRDSPCTPITTLLSSIQRGFLFTPSTPLSPPQNYLPAPTDLPEKRQTTTTANGFTKGLVVGAPFCIPLEDSAADDLDRHALRDLN